MLMGQFDFFWRKALTVLPVHIVVADTAMGVLVVQHVDIVLKIPVALHVRSVQDHRTDSGTIPFKPYNPSNL